MTVAAIEQFAFPVFVLLGIFLTAAMFKYWWLGLFSTAVWATLAYTLVVLAGTLNYFAMIFAGLALLGIAFPLISRREKHEDEPIEPTTQDYIDSMNERASKLRATRDVIHGKSKNWWQP